MATFHVLWPAVLPGGVYFVEDTITGRPSRWDDTHGERVVIDVLHAWSEQLSIGPFGGLPQHKSLSLIHI